MSIYTWVNPVVVDALNKKLLGGTFILRMKPIYVHVPWDGISVCDCEFYVCAEKQVRYWAWGINIPTSILFEVLDNGNLFTPSRYDAITIIETCEVFFGKQFVYDNFYCDNDCLWDYDNQKWVSREDYL